MRTTELPMLRNGMSNLVRDFFPDDFFGRAFHNDRSLPGANVIENNDEWIIEMSVPGMNKDDFKIEVNNDVLTVSTEVTKTGEESNKDYSYREFYVNSFERRFNLPEGKVNEDGIKGSYKDGILSIVLPKVETAKRKAPRMISLK